MKTIDIQVGEPLHYESLSIFPLFADQPGAVEYRLATETIETGRMRLTEVDGDGTVPELIVENRGRLRVLLLEGEELLGGKQNRVVNTSVLVPAGETVRIPVSCVEQGRWRATSGRLASCGPRSSSSLRRVLKGSVGRSAMARGTRCSDQMGVWQTVRCQLESLGTCSATGAFAETFATRTGDIETYVEHLGYVPHATGMAAAVGDRLVLVELFDKPSTCEKVWPSLVAGLTLDSLVAPRPGTRIAREEVDQTLLALNNGPWKRVEPIGEGDESRAEIPNLGSASSLSFQGEPVHISLVLASA